MTCCQSNTICGKLWLANRLVTAKKNKIELRTTLRLLRVLLVTVNGMQCSHLAFIFADSSPSDIRDAPKEIVGSPFKELGVSRDIVAFGLDFGTKAKVLPASRKRQQSINAPFREHSTFSNADYETVDKLVSGRRAMFSTSP